MQKYFSKPNITSQFNVCCIPFKMDTYFGCSYGCLYCFARDCLIFHRKNCEHKQFSYLKANDYIKFEKWVNKVLNSQINYNDPQKVAFKQRIPIKIGSMADPFPYIEKKERVTYNFLKILQKIDYPVQISTKNPQVFLQYAQEFKGANIALNVTLTTVDDNFSKFLQPGCISPSRRLQAIKKLTQMGFKVFVRIQPFIYQQIMKQLQEFICKLKQAGVWGFNTEGLKCRINLPKSQQQMYQKIGDYFGFNLRQYFKKNGKRTKTDYEYSDQVKKQVFIKMQELANKYNLKFYVADNCLVQGIGCGSECCGTECLRNYKIFQLNKRTNFYKQKKQFTEHFQKCILSKKNVRTKSQHGKTIQQIIREKEDWYKIQENNSEQNKIQTK